MKRSLAMAGLTAASFLSSVSLTHAQHFEQAELDRQKIALGSPERLAVEVRAGTFVPNANDTAFDIFGGDKGPLIGGEIDAFFARIPYVGLVGVGASFGWAEYKGSARVQGSSETATEKTSLRLFPISPVLVLRVDALSRLFSIPFVFAGKVGADFTIWKSKTGSNTDGSGISFGLRWAAQVALELDFFNRAAARRLDEEWGINHSFVFFEIYRSNADSEFPPPKKRADNDALPLATKGGVSWAAGLGLIF